MMFEQPSVYFYEIPTSDTRVLKKINETKNCLRDCYFIDYETISAIIVKLSSLLENSDYHPIINEFIEKSNRLNIQFSKEIIVGELPIDDAVLQAPKWHEILFENPCIRVLWTESIPGDKEPFHTHQWKSLMVIIQPGRYEIENVDGSLEKDLWPVGVYELPAETSASAYTNIGTTEFKALRFEIKNSSNLSSAR